MARASLGIAAADGIIYTWYGLDSDTAMHRTNGTTGALIDGDSTPWLDSSVGVLMQWVDPAVSYNRFMAIGKDKIGIVSQDGTNGLRLRLINRTAGTTASTTVISATTTLYACDICADASDNFYVVWASSGTAFNRLSKYNSSGTHQWTDTAATRIYGCAYDRIRGKLQVVGQALAGGSNTVADVDPSDGSFDDGANVSSSTWLSITADGRMGWVIGKADTVARITGDGEYTVTWTRTLTGYSGYQVAAANGQNGLGFLSPSNRVVRLVGVSNGTVTCFDRHGLIPVTSGASALNAYRPVVFAVDYNARLYFADGVNTKRYNPLTNTMEAWTASAGSFPVGTASDYPRLIEAWRGRIVQAGIPTDPDNWFATKQNTPTDWDYTDTTDQKAVAGNQTAGVGRAPDIITSLCALGDDRLLIGCDHMLTMLVGDPAHGGTQQILSNDIGMAWGRPYCRDTWGTLYFMSSRGQVYKLSRTGGLDANPLSRPIERILEQIDMANTIVRMAWDDEEKGFYLILTPLSSRGHTRHFWFDGNGWFPDRFKKAGYNPRVVYLYDGDEPDDRQLIIGCGDGYARYFEPEAADDDGQAIESYVYMGPYRDVLLKELRAWLPTSTGQAQWTIHAGESAEKALVSLPTAAGTVRGGRNRSQPARRHGHSLYVRLENKALYNRWALDRLQAVMVGTGRIRKRVF